MRDRKELHPILQDIIGEGNPVYFQAPDKSAMRYPCIKYELTDIDADYAGNKPYSLKSKYKIMLITTLPVSDAIKKLAALPTSRFTTHYVADNLHHYVYEIYY